jgi:hypothetical protein
MFGLVTRRHHEAELAAVRSYNNALRERCELAEKNEAAERGARRTITRQHAEADAANRRLSGRVLELGRRLSLLAESDPEYAARLERRVARLLKVVVRVAVASHAERLRAEHLQKRLDDAVGLASARPLDSAAWQPGYVAPEPGPKVSAS